MHVPITSVFFLLTKRKGGWKCATDQQVCVSLSELHGQAICYAQDERMVRLGAFECEGGSSDAYLATAVSGEG